MQTGDGSRSPEPCHLGCPQKWLQSSGPSPGPVTAVPTEEASRVLSTVPGTSSVVIGASKPKNDVDWAIYRASFKPSPADYNIKDGWVDSKGGGRFSTAHPKEHLDWIAYYASQIPAPGIIKSKERRSKVAEYPFLVRRTTWSGRYIGLPLYPALASMTICHNPPWPTVEK